MRRTGEVAGIAGFLGTTAAGLSGCPPTENPYIIPAWPWAYSALDVERVRKLGHQSFYAGGCCFGAFDGIVRALVEAVGDPFDKVVTGMMRYGAGGAAGFGSLCGALNGSAAAIGLVSDKDTQNKLVAELLSWYAATPLPTDIANEYARDHAYLVETLKTDEWLESSVAGGELCHLSVTNWCLTSGFKESDIQRSERCARLTGDVAARAVELLNANLAGTFVSENPLPS
ncbi:MAG: C_GCAxxG_C_C family protein, partial [Candidatus Hydrogenedentes bacterium]|nr:C_GCAxxG_C_C family protein [Candidatus Hydrogenedentota bacterium]